MSFEIRFTPEAEESFDAISSQLKERFSDSIVLKFESAVLKNLNLIINEPELYPLIDGYDDVRKCVVHKNCSILYRVSNIDITIICFWDNRQKPML